MNQAKCPKPWCREDFHGLAITARMRGMRRRWWGDPAYRYDEDNSPVLCPGSTFEGKFTPPTVSVTAHIQDVTDRLLDSLSAVAGIPKLRDVRARDEERERPRNFRCVGIMPTEEILSPDYGAELTSRMTAEVVAHFVHETQPQFPRIPIEPHDVTVERLPDERIRITQFVARWNGTTRERPPCDDEHVLWSLPVAGCTHGCARTASSTRA
ncbi:hypothetical protein IU474_26005 [Nocardia otitidiscaviarum]|uniref:hypothetical protein n=1 Tax=Nocardia otitidiscaviarum TaxID=1823 RepID=UPI0018949588|nr:hypothetical protein [Nocardia otitidiscaviarum]MBF6240503.1 hypothetical protein [Nocardia otitidiscaviarum]